MLKATDENLSRRGAEAQGKIKLKIKNQNAKLRNPLMADVELIKKGTKGKM